MLVPLRMLRLYFCISFVPSIIFAKLLFTVTNWNTCLPDELKLKTIVGISLRPCVAECGKRESCEYIGYVRYQHLCQLYTGLEPTSLLKQGSCLVISRQDIDNLMFPDDCTCAERNVCNAGTCEYKECTQLSFTNGYVVGNGNDVLSRNTINCESGYTEVNGEKTVTCETSGNWSYIPSCISTTVCSDMTIANGDLIGTGNGVSAVRTIVCDTGYEEVSDETSVQCKNTGYWSYTPTCSLIIVCVDITIANGDLIGTGNGVGAVRTIVCDTGYEEVSDETSVQCKNTGYWSYTPICSLIIVCVDITIANGDLIGTGNGVGAVRTIVCDTGYEEVSDETSVQCKNTGYWSYIPTCSLIIVCGDITTANGDLIGTGYEVGAMRTIVCDTGYEEMSGETSITCDSSGTWNYIPVCKMACQSASGHTRNGFNIQIYISESKKWDDAQTICSSGGGKLAIIDESWKMEFINEILTSCAYSANDYWTDGNTVDGVWKFADNTLVPMTEHVFWFDGKPDSYGADKCARVEGQGGVYLWDDSKCRDKFKFICEY